MTTTTQTEADVTAACDQLAAALGYIVERYEQRRASRICEGLPDRRYVHRARAVVLWCELKAPKGKLTRAQHAWLTDTLNANALATCVDSVHQLAALFDILGRGGSIAHAQAHGMCAEWVRLTALRGYRAEKVVALGRRKTLRCHGATT